MDATTERQVRLLREIRDGANALAQAAHEKEAGAAVLDLAEAFGRVRGGLDIVIEYLEEKGSV